MKRKLIALVVGVLVVVGFAAGLMIGVKEQVVEDEKVNVVVSILPLAGFVEDVGGEKVEVSVMVLPGESPHTYEPTLSQLVDVSKARMFVKAGSGVEFELARMDEIMEANRDMRVVDSSQGVELMGKDPHIWNSPLNAKTMVENICDGLIRVDQENEEYYIQNKNEYLSKLDELDKDIRESLEGIENRRFIVFHPAWGYFARDYNLEQIPIEVEGKEPSAQDIVHLIEKAKEYNVKVVFASPQFDARSAEAIANEIDGRVVFIDPLARDYINNMHLVLGELVQGLE
jgi:zinc transport system substrate-binding protein